LVRFEYQAETAPVHAVVAGIKPGEVVFDYYGFIIDFKLVFQGVAAAEHLVVTDLLSIYIIFVINKFLIY
jgi:hypothetical protein